MAGNHVLLETIALTQNATSVVFDNIPQTGYTDLKIVISARSTQNGAPYGVSDISMRFNNNTESVYSYKGLTGTGSGTNSFALSNENIFTYIAFGTGSDATTNTFGNSEIYIPNYTSTNAKSVSVDTVSETNATAALMRLNAGIWNPATQAAITRIDLYALTSTSSNFVAGSTFSLYGVAATGTIPAVAPKATGGNIVANDGTYWYHAFLSSGNFVPQTNLTCNYLVVAGGGGGGWNGGGGGGAGGLLSSTTSLTSSTNYAVTIGAGGTAGILSGNIPAGQGNASSLGAISATGGGRGGSSSSVDATRQGGSGGSGGGASGYGINTSTTTLTTGGSVSPSGQGNTGGGAYGNNVAPYGYGNGGGGGGAGTAGSSGSNGSPWSGGNGGDGATAYSSWGSATLTGENVGGTYYYAGGGAGFALSTGTRARGGYGGGGQGGVDGGTDSTVGTINTGGGGGGSRGNNTDGKAGGSGIVIIRYPMA